MRKAPLVLSALALSVVGAPAKAQTTYQLDRVPKVCQAATAANVPLNFYQFNCRGVFYNNGAIEVFFTGSSIEVYTSAWAGYNIPVSLRSFTQPSPETCPVVHDSTGYHSGCPAGSTPGTFTFTWSGTGTDGLVHSGSVSETWFDIQYIGGTRAWYYPVLESAALTVN